ncbi:30S ribosomal protein S15 [Candidatus Woesearchaeota archaeon]|nr:MAG: 30S ribosomal protein S15 [Candidatus Woesearchaeota archaeon]
MATKGKKDKSWVRIKPNEIEKLVLKFAKQGKSPSVIGMILRDEYGVPDIKKATGKSVTKILEDANFKLQIPEDLRALIRKSLELRKHLEVHKHDAPAKRSLAKTEARIRKMVKYYKKKNKLSQDWKYHPEKIKLLLH